VPKAKQTMGGLMLEAVAPFGREDRLRCREFVKVQDAVFAADRAVALLRGLGTGSAGRENARNGTYVPPADMEDRIAAARARVLAEGPEPEPVWCWGACGRSLPRGAKASKWGWKVKRIRCGSGWESEVHCSECFAKWGFVKTRKGAP
jgi:hypothetical protein